MFGNLLHTHIKGCSLNSKSHWQVIFISYLPTGHGLVVRHYRQNNNCSVLEELQPIAENRRYDFNFQQIDHLPREVKILPVRHCGTIVIIIIAKFNQHFFIFNVGRFNKIAMLLQNYFSSNCYTGKYNI